MTVNFKKISGKIRVNFWTEIALCFMCIHQGKWNEVMATIWNVWCYIKNQTPSIDAYLLEESLTLIQPASKWMHWATLWRHSDLFWATTSTSSQVIPILNKSLLTVLLQFVHGRPGPLLNPGTSQCNTCRGMRWWSIRITCPSQRSLLSLSMSSILCCPVLTPTSSFVTWRIILPNFIPIRFEMMEP